MTLADRRRDAVARLLRARRISTQEELLSQVQRAGFRATQATLSRDLARLGARRVSRPEGAFYEVDGPLPAEGPPVWRGLVTAIDANASLVVVRTAAGAASAVARAVDDARLPEVLGTIAGDDTIFVAPAGEVKPRRLAARLGELLGLPVAEPSRAGSH